MVSPQAGRDDLQHPVPDSQISKPRSMLLNICTFIVLLLAALLIGTTFAHMLEMPAKLALDGPQWVHLQQSLYRAFASIGGAVEIAAVVAAAIYAYLIRDQRLAFQLAVF